MCCDGRLRKQLALEDLSVLRCLSEGRFSKVLLVSLQGLGPAQALRVVPREALCSRRRYQRSILEKLEHPFVVRHLQAFEQPDSLYLLQEYCPRGNLALLLRFGALAEPEARPLLGELALALEFLHRHEISYRNLRPETVLFCCQGHAKLADLDVVVTERAATDSLYSAPESRHAGSESFARAADWYSLGAVASHALEGRAPLSRDQMAPKSASVKARNFVTSLTKTEAADRLGSGEGDGCDVRAHMFFAGVCFPRLLAEPHLAAPWSARLPMAEAGQQDLLVAPMPNASARTIIAAPQELQVHLLSSTRLRQPQATGQPVSSISPRGTLRGHAMGPPVSAISLSRVSEESESWLWDGVARWTSRLSGLFIEEPQDPEASISVVDDTVEISFTPDRRRRCGVCV